MRTVFGLTILAALLIGGAWWVAGLPGTVSATIGETTLGTTVPVALVLLSAVFLALYIVIRLLSWLVFLPRRVRRRGVRDNRRRGDRAVTRTLVALASGDPDGARRQAERSRRLMGDTPLTLLLTAQADRQAGREEQAAETFRLLAARKDASFLGLRGLLRQATAKEDWQAAALLAQQAEAAQPGTRWLQDERRILALRTGAWSDALRLSGPESRGALALAAAGQATDPNEALRLSKQAWKADPGLPPAAVDYARRLRAAGKDSPANDVLRRSWATQPHPDIATEYMADVADPARRLAVARGLAQQNATHPESMLLLARVALDAGMVPQARTQLEAAREAGLNQRRLWVLMANLADREGDAAGAQDALRHVATADPDPVWRCGACGTVHDAWHPVCDACGTPGKIAWVQPDQGVVIRQMPMLSHARDEGLG